MADAAPPGAPARSGHVTVTGEADSVQQRMEWMNEGSRSIWTFRLDGTDQNGTRLGPVQVEMRGISFEGSLTNGDSVRVSGRWRGGAIHADQVQNLTTGAVVRAKNYKGLRIAVLAIFAVVVAAIAFFAVDSARDAAERREELEQRQQELMDRQQELPEGFCKAAENAGLDPPQCQD